MKVAPLSDRSRCTAATLAGGKKTKKMSDDQVFHGVSDRRETSIHPPQVALAAAGP